MTEPFATGRDADVFALDEHRVLRRYRRAADVTAEAAIMRHVAAHGYPVPTVFEASGRDLVMTRIDGPTMRAALATGRLAAGEGAVMLAGLLERLHAVPVPAGTDGTAVIHLDLHPDNVLVSAAGPTVIDWANARTGAPDTDTAMSALILAQVAVGATVVPDLGTTAAGLAAEFLDRFLERAPGEPRRGLDAALAIRRGDAALTELERETLTAAADRVRNGTGG